MAARAPSLDEKRGGWQIKRVNSVTGPSEGTVMTDAIENRFGVEGQTDVLWSGPYPNQGLNATCKFLAPTVAKVVVIFIGLSVYKSLSFYVDHSDHFKNLYLEIFLF